MSPLSPQRTHAPQTSPQRGEKRKSPVRLTTSLSFDADEIAQEVPSSKVFERVQSAFEPRLAEATTSPQRPFVSQTRTEPIIRVLTLENLANIYIAASFPHSVPMRILGRIIEGKFIEKPFESYVDFEFQKEDPSKNIRTNTLIPKGFTHLSFHRIPDDTNLSWLKKSHLSNSIFAIRNKNQCIISFKTLMKSFSGYQDYHINGDKNPIDDKKLSKMPFNKEFVRGLLIMKNMILGRKDDKGNPKYAISPNFNTDLESAIKKHNSTEGIENRSVFNILREF